jgi:ferritin
VTLEFLNWFFREQREEEYKARRALELFEVIGEEGTGRWQIDKHVGQIVLRQRSVASFFHCRPFKGTAMKGRQ